MLADDGYISHSGIGDKLRVLERVTRCKAKDIPKAAGTPEKLTQEIELYEKQHNLMFSSRLIAFIDD
jgi:hypothetical protein